MLKNREAMQKNATNVKKEGIDSLVGKDHKCPTP